MGEDRLRTRRRVSSPPSSFFYGMEGKILYLYDILRTRRKKRNCMKPGKTELRLNAEIEKRGALFAVLLDPDTSDEAAFVKAGAMAAENGADLLLVGGSYLGNFTLPKQVAALKANVDLPVVLFPGGASQVVPGFDAMLFMTLVSGRNPNCLID